MVSPSSAARLAQARKSLDAAKPPILIVGASRAAADEFALALAAERGATFGVTRMGLTELVAKLAVPALAKRGLTPSAPLSDEAVAARVADDLLARDQLEYFTPVGLMPGFPRALSRTLSELRMAGIDPDRLSGHPGNDDLSELLASTIEAREKAGAVDYATMLETATAELTAHPEFLATITVVLLDVAINSKAEAVFVRAVIAAAMAVVVTVPTGDRRTLEELGLDPAGTAPGGDAALHRLQRHLFTDEPPSAGESDESVVLFSAPGEGREAIEIARRLLTEAAQGTPFDQMAVLLRAPHIYLSVLEHALDRAGIPAWFHRGTRRPDPAGRALLALLACADEGLSARRFAEYVSIGQVPLTATGNADQWSPPADELVEALLSPADRAEDTQPEDEAQAQVLRGESANDLAGTLRAPWRWEDLIVEAAVIGKLERWQRRLMGLQHEYDRRVREASSEGPEASRVRGLIRDREQLRALRAFAEPILAEMAEWPPSQSWGEWLVALERLAPLDGPAPLQKMDPLTRGDLFHQMQAAALRRLQADGLLPLSADNLPAARQRLTTAIHDVQDREYDRLHPAIDRVWRDEMAVMAQDLQTWLEKLAEEGAEWTPERFEFSFGLPDMAGRDDHSIATPATIDGRFQLRGSIDMIERHRKTGFLRVTDHKTGKNRTRSGQTVVDGGRVLQPVIYGLALKALFPNETVYSGRLSYCTTAGGFQSYEIPLIGDAPKKGLEVLEIIDRAVENGALAARPAHEACKWCDFKVVCGRGEEQRTRRKDAGLFSDLDALRKLP